MLKIAPSAVREIKRILQNRKKPDALLKLAIISGGCSGLFYQLQLEKEWDSKQDNSEVGNLNQDVERLEIDGIQMSIDRQSWQYLENLTIDYAEDLMGGGFRFGNDHPQIKNICGCGMSFAISDRLSD